MPIPALSEQGLLPPGRHPCAFSEIPPAFCWNPHRKMLWEKFQAFWDWYQPLRWQGQVYLNGGFVTDKQTPEDIDMVTDLSGCEDGQLFRALVFMAQNQTYIFNTFNVHFWFNFPDNNDFAAFFQYAGTKTAALKGIHYKHPKGILRIIE